MRFYLIMSKEKKTNIAVIGRTTSDQTRIDLVLQQHKQIFVEPFAMHLLVNHHIAYWIRARSFLLFSHRNLFIRENVGILNLPFKFMPLIPLKMVCVCVLFFSSLFHVKLEHLNIFVGNYLQFVMVEMWIICRPQKCNSRSSKCVIFV